MVYFDVKATKSSGHWIPVPSVILSQELHPFLQVHVFANVCCILVVTARGSGHRSLCAISEGDCKIVINISKVCSCYCAVVMVAAQQLQRSRVKMQWWLCWLV